MAAGVTTTDAAEPVLRARAVERVYGRGASLAVVGRSGSGKSTLMHVLALLDRPTSGEVIVQGRDAARLRPRELNPLRNKTFGFVFQQFFLTPGKPAGSAAPASTSLRRMF